MPCLQILEKHRVVLSQRIKALARQRRFLQTQLNEQKFPTAVFYDNRFNKKYFKTVQKRCTELQAKKTRSTRELEELINFGLSGLYAQDFYPDLAENRIMSWHKIRPGESDAPLDHLFNGFYYFKISSNPSRAQKYFSKGLTRIKNYPSSSSDLNRQFKATFYNCLAMSAEALNQPSVAIDCLTKAIQLHEASLLEQHSIKYLCIRRGMLHAGAKNYDLALADLTQAARYRIKNQRDNSILNLDDVICWEQAKICCALGATAAAHQLLDQLIGLYKLNHHDLCQSLDLPPPSRLIQIIKNYRARLPKNQPRGEATTIDNYLISPPLESPGNYKSCLVNVKCPHYQKFISELQSQRKHNAVELEYLAAYYFGCAGNNRDYEAGVPRNLGKLSPWKDKWWLGGVRNFYLLGDYVAAAEFFENYVEKTPDSLGYELAAKARLATGARSLAQHQLTAGLTLLKKQVGAGEPRAQQIEQIKSYHLLQGIIYFKQNKNSLALKEFENGLQLYLPTFLINTIDPMLYWNRALVWLAMGETPKACDDLREIKDNPAVKKYLAHWEEAK